MQSVSSRIWTRVAVSISYGHLLLFTHSWRENNWIHTFSKGISALWNAIRVWTRVAGSISYDDNHYTTGIYLMSGLWQIYIPIKLVTMFYINYSPVGLGFRVHRLHFCWGVTSPNNVWPGYNTKLSDGEAPVLELWVMWSTLSLPLLTVSLWPGTVLPVRVPLDNNTWNHLTVCIWMDNVE